MGSLRAAVDHGADAVYTGFRDATNARHFPGLNFTPESLREAVQYVHRKQRKIFVAINTYPQPAGWPLWTAAVDTAVTAEVDALILADIGLLEYAKDKWPDMPLHLSVQASATNWEALDFYHRLFAIRRAVLPRVLSLRQVTAITRKTPVAIEVFGFGSLCVMAEGRCLLSSYVTGRSPNSYGACSPASHVRWSQTPAGLEARVSEVLVDRYQENEKAAYPTLCKGRYQVEKSVYYALEEPTSLNTLDILPALMRAGVQAIKVEGRQRGPAYVRQVTVIFRAAIDACLNHPECYRPDPDWQAGLSRLAEGAQTTLGAYHRPWH
jgi:putative protease